MKAKIFLAVILSVLLTNVEAGQVAYGEIEEMANTISGHKLFAIKMSASSTGPCAGQWVQITESSFGTNIEAYKFAFSMAAMAIASGKKIRAHNYSSDSCSGVTFIGVYK